MCNGFSSSESSAYWLFSGEISRISGKSGSVPSSITLFSVRTMSIYDSYFSNCLTRFFLFANILLLYLPLKGLNSFLQQQEHIGKTFSIGVLLSGCSFDILALASAIYTISLDSNLLSLRWALDFYAQEKLVSPHEDSRCKFPEGSIP